MKTRVRTRSAAGLAALLLLPWGAAGQSVTSSLLAGTRLTRLSSGESGVAATLDWVRVSDRLTRSVGLTGATLGGDPWATGRGELALRTGRGRVVAVSLEAGGGRQGGAPFWLGRIGASWREPVVDGRVYASLQGQAIRMDESGSTLLQPGLTLAPHSRLLVSGTLGTTLGGAPGARYALLRLDWRGRPVETSVGALVGRTLLSPVLDALAAADRPQSRWQAFAGVSFPFGTRALGVVVDHIDAGAHGRTSLLLTIREPLR